MVHKREIASIGSILGKRSRAHTLVEREMRMYAQTVQKKRESGASWWSKGDQGCGKGGGSPRIKHRFVSRTIQELKDTQNCLCYTLKKSKIVAVGCASSISNAFRNLESNCSCDLGECNGYIFTGLQGALASIKVTAPQRPIQHSR